MSEKKCAECGDPAEAYVFHRRFDGELHPAKYCSKHFALEGEKFFHFTPHVIGFLTLDLHQAFDMAYRWSRGEHVPEAFDPTNPRPSPIVWSHSEALDFIRRLSGGLAPRYYLALAGSVLLKGSSTKDLDLIVFPASTQDQDKAFVEVKLKEAGLVKLRDVESMHEGWRRKGSDDTKHVEVWEYQGKRVDFLYLA